MELLILIIDWLHLFATIIWIGAMVILMVIIIPSTKEILKDELLNKRFLKVIGKKITLLVNISIIIIIITGIILGILINLESVNDIVVLIVKHILVSIMVCIHIGRIIIIAPRLERKSKENPENSSFKRLQKLQMNLVWINLILGIIIVFFSIVV
ncbi:MAG: hypothetical protein GF317_04170 [Candidatus Lokiarchaeota archaeon]|nr:hypothetical protein [Candidatus Lokiarchaeota archaeon]MBD3199083.1 hypothetical protein [Candidatus Lokiarchaeota archaeon]